MLLSVLVVAVAVCCLSLGVEANSKMDQYRKRTGAKWLSEKEAEKGVHKLPSGMLFKILNRGTGDKSPTANDDCSVHYTGTLKDGTKFDSSVDRGEPATFKPTQVIKGWTEALQLMREGDKWEVYIPYDMAYGAHGSPPKIPGYSPLIFQMELLKVKGKGKPATEAITDLETKTGKKYEEL
jgi:FKBP-type peptidyl-prolyl cis-trans isomerase FklB